MSLPPDTLRALDLLEHPSVPDSSSKASDDQQHREVPQGIVAQPSASAQNNEDTRELVADSFFSQLHCGQRDDTDGGGVEAREKSVDRVGERLADMLHADGEGVHADCTGQTSPSQHNSKITGKWSSYLQIKNVTTAGMNPACSRARQNSIFVLPGPGRPWQIANSS